MSYLISGAHVVVDINSDAGAFLWLILRWLLRACHCVDGRDGMGWDGVGGSSSGGSDDGGG